MDINPNTGTPKSTAQSVPFAFAFTIFLSAFLLFQIQLLISKKILPWYGGAAAVWNTCVVVFQALLLAGYAYSHVLVSKCSPRRQSRIHGSLVLLSLAIIALQLAFWRLPLLPAESLKPFGSAHPILSILQVLGVSVALPFFVLSTTGPLIQSWFARTSPQSSPYKLYATSNAGSLLGLASYPFLIEWLFHLKSQAWIWTVGYLIFAAAIVLLAGRVSRVAPSTAVSHPVHRNSAPLSWKKISLWIGLSACPSAMMLAATSQISSDVPPVPFLWMLPLMLYLLTLMICFDNDSSFRRRIYYPFHFVAILGLLYLNAFVKEGNVQVVIFLYCLAVFTTGMITHGELARSKPANEHLTAFYLAMALGGVLGGSLIGLVAPAILHDLHEFRFTLAVTFLLAAAALSKDPNSWLRRGTYWATGWILAAMLLALVPATNVLLPWLAASKTKNGFLTLLFFLAILLLSWAFSRRVASNSPRPISIYFFYLIFVAAVGIGFTAHFPFRNGQVVFTERNFFGVKRIVMNDTAVLMTHGSTLHGVAYIDRVRRDLPMSYYSTDSGVGLLFRNFPRDSSRGLRVGVIGLGAGVLASYAKPHDTFRFYEIDPQVVKIAQGQNSYFHFVEDSRAEMQFSEGDARINLEQEIRQQHPQQFDILILDAFSGDTVPMHLLTREAMQVYLQHLRGPQSVMAVHISNRYIDLKPVLDALARNYSLNIAYLPARDSHWMLLSPTTDVFASREIKLATFNSFLTQKPVLWTDDYSNLLPLL